MSNWIDTVDESKNRWEQNSDFWDEKMGEESNRFHREIIRPETERLLSIKEGDKVLDIACGNGNFSKRMVELGAKVTAFDYSENMIANAKRRCKEYLDNIEFHVVDATKYEQLIQLKNNGQFDKAVSNMAIMDIADIGPLFNAVYEMLIEGGIFVFSIMHPCFQTPHMRKITETEDVGNSVRTRYGIQIFEYITPSKFEWNEIPPAIIVKLMKHK